MTRDHLMGYRKPEFYEEWADPLTRAMRLDTLEKQYDSNNPGLTAENLDFIERQRQLIAFERGDHLTDEMKAERDAILEKQREQMQKPLRNPLGDLFIPIVGRRPGIEDALRNEFRKHFKIAD